MKKADPVKSEPVTPRVPSINHKTFLKWGINSVEICVVEERNLIQDNLRHNTRGKKIYD